MSWNVEGVKKHIPAIHKLLDDQNIDIMGLQEIDTIQSAQDVIKYDHKVQYCDKYRRSKKASTRKTVQIREETTLRHVTNFQKRDGKKHRPYHTR